MRGPAGIGVGVCEAVGVKIDVGVCVAVNVGVKVGVYVFVGVCVIVGVLVTVEVGVSVAVKVGVAVGTMLFPTPRINSVVSRLALLYQGSQNVVSSWLSGNPIISS